jgi:flagellar hook-associated protein 2
MGSPITFGGFNQIDFTVVLNAIMQQESRPLQVMQAHQSALQATDGNLLQLTAKLDALRDASAELSSPGSVLESAATSSNANAVATSGSSGALPGHYDIVVTQLARAQVTASASTTPDFDSTVVATGGSLTIGGVTVTFTGPVTLQELAAGINGTEGITVSATIVQVEPGAYRLVLTSHESGAGQAFTVENALTGAAVSFTDTDGDNVSGDSAADNAVQASDAALLVNNIAVISSTNTIVDAVPGLTLSLLKADPDETIAVTVTRDQESLVGRVETFVSAYNALVKFANEQTAAAAKGATGTLGRDALLRTLRNSLRTTLNSAYGTDGFTRLAEVGIGFTRTGELTLDKTRLATAVSSDEAAVHNLFAVSDGGVFGAVETLIEDYTRSGGLVPGARTRLNEELSRLGRRMEDMQARLAIRRLALQQEFIAADQAMARLNSQSDNLASVARGLTTTIF